MPREDAMNELLDERNDNIAEWIGRMPEEYWYKVAIGERVARREAEQKARTARSSTLKEVTCFVEEFLSGEVDKDLVRALLRELHALNEQTAKTQKSTVST